MTLLTTVETATAQGLRLGALALLAAGVALVAAVAYRWYVREALPQGVGLLVGATGIAIVLNTTAALGQSIGGTAELLDAQTAGFTVAAFVLGGVASEGGRRIGTALGDHLTTGDTVAGLDRDVTAFVRGGGRTLRVRLPDEIHDIDGHDPVRSDIKADLAGQTMTFPGRITRDELQEAFTARLIGEIGVGAVDAEFTDEGELVYLALGRGEAGLGHTLQPGQVAVAIQADPAFSASPGDQVAIWRRGPDPSRVLAGEVRGIAGDTVTLAVDADRIDELDESVAYRLVTRPDSPEPGRELATLLRRANEQLATVSVAADSALVGHRPHRWEVAVLAGETADGTWIGPLERDRPLAAGDEVVALGRPDALRRFASLAQGTSP